MTDVLMALYRHLPPSLRSVGASLSGYRLHRWRYGPETDRLVERALERDTWDARQWEVWLGERLAYVLHRSSQMVPYYRDYWLARRRHGDRSSPDVLQNWPVLKKEAVRENPRAFVAEDCDVRSMYHLRTSGSTGKPLSLWWSRATVRSWYALFEARTRQWYGVSRHDRWAILGGRLVTPFAQRLPPFWVWNAGLRQLYMSSYHLAPDNVCAYLQAMRAYGVSYMLGYPSSMYALAQVVLERHLEVPPLRVAVSNAEPFYDHQRKAVAEAFRCPVRDTYGMAEIACAAGECASGTMHLWPEVGLLEVLRDDSDLPLPPTQVGRLICTGLLNADMPLIRYEVGDRGAAGPQRTACTCGRTLPAMYEVEGRLGDTVLTQDGRRVSRLTLAFQGDLPIREAQVIQDKLGCIRVRLVPAPGYTKKHETIIAQRLRERLGDMDIRLEPVEQIPRSANGKFRAVVSHLGSSPARAPEP